MDVCSYPTLIYIFLDAISVSNCQPASRIQMEFKVQQFLLICTIHAHLWYCRQFNTARTHTHALSTIHLLGKCPWGQMSFWANVFLGKCLLGKCLLGKCCSGQMSFWANVFWANVFLGKYLFGQMSSGQMSIWANVFLGKCLLGKWLLGKFVLGKCLWANVSGQLSYGQMSYHL
jgi:hypothetical protein